MYKSFRVKNFRCFKDLQINDLGRVNLIAGKNNIGKTALLEAMYIHSGNREPRTFLRVQPRTGFRASRELFARDPEDESANIISWATAFRDFDPKLAIELSADFRAPQQQMFGENKEQRVLVKILSEDNETYADVLNEYNFEDYEVHRSTEILEVSADYNVESRFYILVSGRVLSAKIRAKPLIPSEFLESMRHISSRRNAQRFSNLRKSIGTLSTASAMQVIESTLKDLEILYDGYQAAIYADLGMNQLMPLTSMGEGMNRMLSLVLAMSDSQVGVVFVDEIENGIHFSIQRRFWKAIFELSQEHKVQVFATTHSYEMIRAAYEAFSETNKLVEFRYHRLSRSRKTGELRATTYSELDLEAVAAFDFDHEVR